MSSTQTEVYLNPSAHKYNTVLTPLQPLHARHSNTCIGAATETETEVETPAETTAADGPFYNDAATFSRFRSIMVVTQLAGINFASSAINGLVIVNLPHMTIDLRLPKELSFWPSSVFSLATASTLLLAGAVADTVGPRRVDLFGCLLNSAMMIGGGFARSGPALVSMRAVQGIGYAMHLASSVSIVTRITASGRGRNIAFSCLGLSQPLGFSFGLVLGGVLEDSVGWRAGWYLYGGLSVLLSAAGLWAIPADKRQQHTALGMLSGLKRNVDWVGVLLASAFMALICYLFAIISTDISKIREPASIVILCLGVATAPAFVAWVHRQVRLGRPALIPNSLWKNTAFAGICAAIIVSFAVLNSLELFSSLFFQQVQQLSALETSIRMLPSLVVGVILNFTMGLAVHRIPAAWIITITSILCAVSPLLMAVIDTKSTYWANAFVAQVLQPVSCDAIFTVGLIVITDIFPEDTQGLAGAVFNTAAQFGNALGLAIMQVVSTIVTQQRESHGEGKMVALLEGFRASFWTMFAFMVACGAIGLSLRKTGRVGLKQD